jgi:hypothetical protein
MIKRLVTTCLVLGLVSCATTKSKRIVKKPVVQDDDEEYGFGTEEDYNSVFYKIGVEQRLSQSAYSEESNAGDGGSSDGDSDTESQEESDSESSGESSEEKSSDSE